MTDLESRFQTVERLIEVVRPYVGLHCHSAYADFTDEPNNRPGWEPTVKALAACTSHANYGNVQISFWQNGSLLDLLLGIEVRGRPPEAGLFLSAQSIAERFAEKYAAQGTSRPTDPYLRIFPLRWPGLMYGAVLEEVWISVAESRLFLSESTETCLCGIGLKLSPDVSGNSALRTPHYLGVSFDPHDEESWRQYAWQPQLPPAIPGSDWQKVL